MEFTVSVLLNMNHEAMFPGRGYTSTDELREAFSLTVAADDERTALEEAFAILNSYPGEMHCGDEYEEVVRSYRAGRNRSLSVGDVLDIGGTRYSCASVGWEVVE